MVKEFKAADLVFVFTAEDFTKDSRVMFGKMWCFLYDFTKYSGIINGKIF